MRLHEIYEGKVKDLDLKHQESGYPDKATPSEKRYFFKIVYVDGSAKFYGETVALTEVLAKRNVYYHLKKLILTKYKSWAINRNINMEKFNFISLSQDEAKDARKRYENV